MRKGTHKIKIWKPCFRKVGPAQTTPADENDVTTITALSGFMLVPVVDVSQLQGDPRAANPAAPTPIALTGDAPAGLWDGVAPPDHPIWLHPCAW